MRVTVWDVQQTNRWADQVYLDGAKVNKALLNGMTGMAINFATDAMLAARLAQSYGYPPQVRRALRRMSGICDAIADTLEIMGEDEMCDVWRRKAATFKSQAEQIAA